MTKFTDLKLDPKVLKAVSEAGYENPTPIQAGAIPPALEGRDVLGIAQTGTGKTASFTLPMITLLGRGRARARMPRSLVLCPTRELAAQVAENFDTYAKHTKLTKALLIGGVSFGEQDKLIDRGVDVLIATPGRLLDHFERGKLLLTGVQIMVVDEADRMLDMGFIPDIERIFQLTPFTRQTLFFSATMAPEIERITDTFLHSPERIEVARQATTSETITQRLVEITPTRRDQSAKQKRELLRALIRAEGDGLKNAIIFCNRKTDVDIVAKSLKAHGFDAAPIHGDLDQRHRMATLDDFRDGKLRVLVASDVAARGLDIPAVSHVINFDLPSHAEDYVHRIGRTGRAGRKGTAISISTPADEKYLTAIEALVNQTLPRAELPEGFQLSAAAQEAPRPPRERENGRGRNRSPRHGRKDETAAPREERAHDGRAHDRREAPERREERKEERRDERRDDRREDRRQDGQNEHREHHRRQDRQGDRNPVLGMGEHVPDFLTRSFRPSIIETPASEAEARGVSLDEARPEPVRNDHPRGQSRRDRPRREHSRPEAPQTEAAPQEAVELVAPAPVEAPEAQLVAEAQVDAVAVTGPVEAPKPRRSRAKAKPAAATDEADAPKPRRRAKASDTAAEVSASEGAAEATPEAEKPKRTRSRAKSAPEGDAAEAPAKPVRRTRKKAAPADAPTAEADPQEAAPDAPKAEA